MYRAAIALVLSLLITGCSFQRERQTLTVCLAGDLLLDRGISEQVERYGFRLLLEEALPLIERVDYTLVNLECPVTTLSEPREKRYSFRGNPGLLSALRSTGITHLNLANNHTLDQGQVGFISTLNNVRAAGFGVSGLDSLGCQPLLLVKEDLRVVFFAFNRIEVDSSICQEAVRQPCVATVEQICTEITRWHERHPNDAVVAFPHWGNEYRSEPSESQRLQARMLIDAGADVVAGHHPHVVQEIETYRGKFILYSLGNFLFDQDRPDAREAWVAELILVKGESIRVQIHRFERDPMFGLTAKQG